jgi:hypothetical protein
MVIKLVLVFLPGPIAIASRPFLTISLSSRPSFACPSVRSLLADTRLQPFRPGARLALLACLAPATSSAAAIRNADDVAQIVHAVMIGDLFARLDAPERADEHLQAALIKLRIGIAGVVGVARDVPARRAIDGPAAVDFKQVFVAALLAPDRLVGIEQPTFVFRNSSAFRDLVRGEQAEAGQGAADAERSSGHSNSAGLTARKERCG